MENNKKYYLIVGIKTIILSFIFFEIQIFVRKNLLDLYGIIQQYIHFFNKLSISDIIQILFLRKIYEDELLNFFKVITIIWIYVVIILLVTILIKLIVLGMNKILKLKDTIILFVILLAIPSLICLGIYYLFNFNMSELLIIFQVIITLLISVYTLEKNNISNEFKNLNITNKNNYESYLNIVTNAYIELANKYHIFANHGCYEDYEKIFKKLNIEEPTIDTKYYIPRNFPQNTNNKIQKCFEDYNKVYLIIYLYNLINKDKVLNLNSNITLEIQDVVKINSDFKIYEKFIKKQNIQRYDNLSSGKYIYRRDWQKFKKFKEESQSIDNYSNKKHNKIKSSLFYNDVEFPTNNLYLKINSDFSEVIAEYNKKKNIEYKIHIDSEIYNNVKSITINYMYEIKKLKFKEVIKYSIKEFNFKKIHQNKNIRETIFGFKCLLSSEFISLIILLAINIYTNNILYLICSILTIIINIIILYYIMACIYITEEVSSGKIYSNPDMNFNSYF